jgi:exonuclease SbcC
MQPVKIELENFTSYASETIDLSGVRFAALVGHNGSGKSSILDAITWALFGEGTKGGKKNLDDYTKDRNTDALVGLEFTLGDLFYRVVRGRSVKRNKSTLEFFRRTNDVWEPISGKTMAETQAKVEQVLRMDYKTFTASSVILQGKSDSFTASMTDTERKDALAKILGLDIWDGMGDRAKEKLKATKAELKSILREEEALSDVMAKKADYLARYDEKKRTHKVTQKELAEAQINLVALKEKLSHERVLKERAQEAERAGLSLQKQKRELSGELTELTQKEAKLLIKVKEAEEVLSQKADITAAVELAAAINTDLETMEKAAREYMEKNRQVVTVQEQFVRWDKETSSTMAAMRAKLESAAAQAATLDKVPCSDQEKEACELLTLARRAAKEAAQTKAALETLMSKENPHGAKLQAVREVLSALSYDPQEHEAAREAYEDAQKTTKFMSKLDLAESQQREAHEAMDELAKKKEALKQKVLALDTDIQEMAKKVKVAKEELSTLLSAKADHDDLERQIQQKETMMQVILTDIGRLEAALDALGDSERRLNTIREQKISLQEDEYLHELFVDACGNKAGVPSLIVENAVPEIERLTNTLLARMGGGRFMVRLDTQAETKTTGTMQEVLRIIVLDSGHERPYSTYSGAEKFMVDLSLRVALSKFLAHRAGAEIKFFVLDEGMGACDVANRASVLEAIFTVADEFEKTLVITHIQEMQDAFPQRIEVEKTADGSKVAVIC